MSMATAKRKARDVEAPLTSAQRRIQETASSLVEKAIDIGMLQTSKPDQFPRLDPARGKESAAARGQHRADTLPARCTVTHASPSCHDARLHAIPWHE